jgi:membrane-bound lytic murein transglycosylase D
LGFVTTACVVAFAQAQSFPSSSDAFSSINDDLAEAADRALAEILADQSWMKNRNPPPREDQNPSITHGDSILRLQGAIDRFRQLKPTLEPILRSEGIPAEFSAIVLVESGGIASALSPKGARGVWQLMPDTARRYGLVVDRGHDDRFDVIKSTHAAARYLRDLYTKFGNWSLALAAYNAGELTVTNAMRRGSSRDFGWLSAKARLPLETRRYVPAIIAAMGLLDYKAHWLVPDERNSPRIVYAGSGSGE